jgi:hypothetical protein
MRQRVTTAVFLWSLAGTAAAQSGAQVTMPPNSRQTGKFAFPNHCLSGQTFKVTAQPGADWMRFEPSTVDVGPNTSFGVQVTVSTGGNRKPGSYRSALMVVCATCAGANPPCFQEGKEFPISLTVANVKAPGDFEPTAEPQVAVPPMSREPAPMPAVVSPDPPRRTAGRLVLWIAGALLVAGVLGILFALFALSGRATRIAVGQMGAESERHQVRR